MNGKFRITGGHIIDPQQKKNEIGDLCIAGHNIVPSDAVADTQYPEIDASGCYVLPGLIDFHTHVYAKGCGFGVHPDYFPATGVTTTVDGGTAGCSNFEAFYTSTIVPSKCRIFADLNVTSQGQFQLGFPENYTPAYFNETRIAELFEEYRGTIVGLKMRLSKETVGQWGVEPLAKMREIADRLEVPMVVHTTNPPVHADEIVSYLRAGDVYCHCYQGEGYTILDETGKVSQGVWKARERGVLFDACNGTLNFNFRVAKAAIAEGFYPDIISSDTSLHSFAVPYYCKNLPFVMSKYLSMGMGMEEIVRATTTLPAKLIGQEHVLGTLAEGAKADVTILQPVHRKMVYGDKKETFEGDIVLVPKMTILNGDVVFCTNDFWL